MGVSDINKQIILMILGCLLAWPVFAGEVEDEWQAYVKPWEDLGPRWVKELWNPEDPLLRQQLYDMIHSHLAAAYVGLMRIDPDNPDFWPVFGPVFNNGLPNPDNVYHAAPVDDQGIYRLSGYRGSVRIMDLSVASGMIVVTGEGDLGPTLANYDFDTLDRDDRGYFEVILSPGKPEGYQGNWWRLEEGATYIMVRQLAYDWLNEVDGRVAIERLDTPARKPLPDRERLDARLRQIPVWTESWLRLAIKWGRYWRQLAFNTEFRVNDFSADSGLTTQRYIDGVFNLQPDEALLLETELPGSCRYWSYQLGDELFRSFDYTNRQSSLNGFQAKLDSDGKFRAVISSRDPGVPNWLDTGGLQRGMILGRFTVCDGAPKPSGKVVKLADIRQHLPKDTPVVTESGRDESLRLRRKGAQLRRRW